MIIDIKTALDLPSAVAEKLTNAKKLPRVYYGLHMVEGVAEYPATQGGSSYRILVSESTIKNMDPTFEGLPVYVRHVDEVNVDNIQVEADGYVIASFFNQFDGKHWAKFIVVSDRGHEAIRNGWKLSNAYIPKDFAAGGEWHGVSYSKEVMSGEYEHLAIVPNPRYEESVILTPDQFKEYNSLKELELKRLANSKGEKSVSILNIFKKTKVENAAELEQTVVELPKSKRQLTITQLVDEVEKIHNTSAFANGDQMVKVGDKEMTVNALVNEFTAMKKNADDEEAKKKNAAEEEEKKKNAAAEEEKKKNAADEEAKKKNAEDEEKKKKENEAKEKEAEEKKKNDKFFNDLSSAPDKAIQNSTRVQLSDDKVKLGKQRYGSK